MIAFLTDVRTIIPILSILLIIGVCLFLNAVIKITHKIAFLLSFYLIGFADIVLSELVANSLNMLNRVDVVLIFQAIIFLITLVIWFLRKRPPLLLPFHDIKRYLSLTYITDYLHNAPEILHLLMAVVLAYGLSFIIGMVVPVNTYDAITTHTARIGYWLQHGNFFPWPTARTMQTSYPVNAQLLLLWTAQVRGTDMFFFLIQWSAAVVTCLAILGIARELGYSRSQSLFAGLIFLCFPLIIMQSNTAQNDLVAAAVFIPTIYFFILGIQTGRRGYLWLSALSLGLSLGTKQTLYFYLPGLLLMAFLVLLRYKKAVWKQLIHWGLACALLFIVFASYMNITNMVYFGTPFGPSNAVESSVGGKDAATAINNIIYNSPRFIYQFIDSSGLPAPLDAGFAKLRYALVGKPLSRLPIQLESNLYCSLTHSFSFQDKAFMGEDSSWFGPLAPLLLIPLMIYQTVYSVRKKDPWRIGLILISFFYLIFDAWLRPGWDPFQGRYFIPAIALVTPFIADLLRPGWGWRTVSMLVTFISIFILVTTQINNPAKPVFRTIRPEKTIWQADRITLMSLQNPDMEEYDRMVEENVPKDAVLGWFGHGLVEYPLFGRMFKRTVIPVYPIENMYDMNWMQENNILYLLVENKYLPDGLPNGFKVIATSEETDRYTLLERVE